MVLRPELARTSPDRTRFRLRYEFFGKEVCACAARLSVPLLRGMGGHPLLVMVLALAIIS
jgi:hypothetical protein